MVAIDWGSKKKSVAAVSDGRVIKFASVRELVKEAPSPALVFAEASGDYLKFCELYENYGSIYLVDTGLVTRFRKKSNVKKSDINDAKVLLALGIEFLAGELKEGVWPFVPDPLKRACHETEKLFRAYQKLQALLPEKAKEFKKQYERLAGTASTTRGSSAWHRRWRTWR